MPAVHKSTTYKPPPIGNPFQEGQDRAYGDLLLHSHRQTNFWRLFVGPGSLLLFAVSIGLFLYALTRQQVVPVLVNVMPSGESAYLGEVRQSGDFRVPEAAITWQLRSFVSNVRSVSVDPYVLNDNIVACFNMSSKAYEPVLRSMLQANSPFSLVGKIRRSVEIQAVIHITGDSYQVDWTETTLDPNGSATSARMRALVTVVVIYPSPDIRVNPLGIYIENCEWTEL